jgi:hypothetical protein
MDVIDCNNHVKSAIKYFGPSCAVNSLIDKYNPIGMYMQMCVSLFHIILNVFIFFPPTNNAAKNINLFCI